MGESQDHGAGESQVLPSVNLLPIPLLVLIEGLHSRG